MTGRGKGEAPEAAGGPTRHTPVLLSAVLEALDATDGERYIDCTFGAGGYARAIVQSADCDLLALDRDPNAAAIAAELAADVPNRFHFRQSPFSELAEIAREVGFEPADAVVFDLGVSSMQLDEAARGFSFMRDGPLDMRMSSEGLSAADVVNGYDEAEIADILFRLGEEKRSRAIARAIVRRRTEAAFERTLDLADLISSRSRPPSRRRAPPGHAVLSGAAPVRQRRAGRAGRRTGRRREDSPPRRTPDCRDVSFSGGPDREEFSGRKIGRQGPPLASHARDRSRSRAELPPCASKAGGAGSGRNRRQSARPVGKAARRGQARCAGMAARCRGARPADVKNEDNEALRLPAVHHSLLALVRAIQRTGFYALCVFSHFWPSVSSQGSSY